MQRTLRLLLLLAGLCAACRPDQTPEGDANTSSGAAGSSHGGADGGNVSSGAPLSSSGSALASSTALPASAGMNSSAAGGPPSTSAASSTGAFPGGSSSAAASSASAPPSSSSSGPAPSSSAVPTGAVVALDDSYTTTEDVTLSVAAFRGVLVNDSTTLSPGVLTAVLETPPQHASSFELRSSGLVAYSSAPDWFGVDTFTYHAAVGNVRSQSATVSITVTPVDDPPRAAPDSYSLSEDGSLVVSAAAGVLANDVDVEGGTLVAQVPAGSGPAHGVLTFQPDGSFTYLPNANWHGADPFAYEVTSGGQMDRAQVSITVLSIRDAPIALDDGPFSVIAGFSTDIPFAQLLANDSTIEGVPLSVVNLSTPSLGVLTADATRVTYSAFAGVAGTDAFSYECTDGSSVDGAAVSMVVVPNQPPVSVADAYTCAANGQLTVAAAYGLLANDSDPDGHTITPRVVATSWNTASLDVQPDGSFTYVPVAGYLGPDEFVYQVTDSQDSSSNTTVHIDVQRCGCPAPIESVPLATVSPTASCSDPDGTIASYRWTVDSRPAGSTALPSPADQLGTSFFLDLAGEYVLRFQALSSGGDPVASCTVPIRVVPPEDLHVQLVWNTDFSDVDMHLLGPGGGTYFSSLDCYFGNRQAAWSGPGTDDDATLDIDDTNGFGPENINIIQPADGTYSLGVHYYCAHGAPPPTRATIRVYCNGQLARELQRDFDLSQQFWDVATIGWPGCTVTENPAPLRSVSHGCSP